MRRREGQVSGGKVRKLFSESLASVQLYLLNPLRSRFFARVSPLHESHSIQVRDIRLQRLLQGREPLLTKSFQQDFLRPGMWSDNTQVCLVILQIRGEFVIWTKFSKNTEDVVPIEGLGEGEDSLVLDIRIGQSRDVQPRVVAYVHEILYT